MKTAFHVFFLVLLLPASLGAQVESRETEPGEAESAQNEDTPAEEAAPRPWADGVPENEQELALSVFQRANDAYSANDYRVAVQLYQQALSHWAHPAIHGNLSVALVYLDRPIEAFRHVEAALEYGTLPLGEVIHGQLLTNRRLLRAQLSTIEVTCDMESVDIALDGEGLFRSPVEDSHLARAGRHRIVASKPGFLTFTQEFEAPPGEAVEVNITLVPLANAATYERRWPSWVPWAVVGGGALLVVSGAVIQRSARNEIDAYQDDLNRLCPNGCLESDLPGAVQSQEARGVRRNRSAISLIGIGAAAVAIGGVLLALNAPKRVEVGADGVPLARVEWSPMLSTDTVGGSVSGSF